MVFQQRSRWRRRKAIYWVINDLNACSLETLNVYERQVDINPSVDRDPDVNLEVAHNDSNLTSMNSLGKAGINDSRSEQVMWKGCSTCVDIAVRERAINPNLYLFHIYSS